MTGFNSEEFVPPTGGGSKMFEPGEVYAKITKLEWEVPKHAKSNEIVIKGILEGPEIEGFQGFDRVYQKPEHGQYKGLMATFKLGEWPYKDWVRKDKPTVPRDKQIYDALTFLKIQLGIKDAVVAGTIEEYMEAIFELIVKQDKFIYVCLAGQEFKKDNSNYINYYFHLPNPKKGAIPVSLTENGEDFLKFDKSKHIKKLDDDTVSTSEADEEFESGIPGIEDAVIIHDNPLEEEDDDDMF